MVAAFARLVALLHLALLTTVIAAPARLSAAFKNETELTINERGELVGELYDERGEMKPNPRVMLQSRQNPGFNYGSSECAAVVATGTVR